MYACFRGRAATALLLVEAGAALDFVGTNGLSALDFADDAGIAAVSSAIRARGGHTGAELALAQASEHAAAGEQAKAARAALGPAAARAKCEQLLGACKRRDAPAALQLIGEGADLDCINVIGTPPLLIASAIEHFGGVVTRLLAAGADLDFVTSAGNSALILACYFKNAPTAMLLIEAGALLNQVNNAGINSAGVSALDAANANGLAFAAVAAAITARGGRAAAELV